MANGINAEPLAGKTEQPRDGAPNPRPFRPVEINPEGETDAVVPASLGWKPPPTVANPLRQVIHWPGMKAGVFARLARLWKRLTAKPELTPEEKDRRAEIARRKALEETLRSESNIAADLITNALTRRGLCYRYKKSERDWFISGVDPVKFDMVAAEPNQLYLRVDIRRLPRGVGILQLMEPDILTDLSLAVGRRVSGEYREDIGAWYIIERATGIRGIPIHVRYQDVIEAIPQTADELTFPLGVTVNSRKVYKSIKDFPHLLIAGNTDTGKSNMVNVIICTLIARNTPDQLRLVLIDLKGGMELAFYENIPHSIKNIVRTETDRKTGEVTEDTIARNGIIDNRGDVLDALDWTIREGKRRMDIIRAAGHKNITGYNGRTRKNKLPRILVIIDELAEIMLSPIGRDAADSISIIASQMRAVGIHLMIATQTPKKEVINTLIKSNLPGKMAFSVPTNVASELILDNGNAKGLTPQGRYIFQRGEELQLQAPYMPDSLVREIVDAVRSGEQVRAVKVHHDVSEQDVLEYALDILNGDLKKVALFEHFRTRGIKKDEIEELLTSLDNRQVTIRENVYNVQPPSGVRPRRLILAQESPNPEK
jgi:hypothetical protein